MLLNNMKTLNQLKPYCITYLKGKIYSVFRLFY